MNGPHNVTAHFTAVTTSVFAASGNPAGSHDGWIRESAEGSGTGGTKNSTGTGFDAIRSGDDNVDRAYRSIVSFDTASIPDGATIVSATLELVRGQQLGNPFATLGQLQASGVPGFFGETAAGTKREGLVALIGDMPPRVIYANGP
jgi:hypothetical protein